MGLKKLPSNATVEELLASLENDDVPDAPEVPLDDDILNFMHAFEIDAGKHLVSRKLLYKIYRNWSKKPLPSRDFVIGISNFLQCDYKHFFISHNKFDITRITEKLLEERKTRTPSRIDIKHFKDFFAYYAIKPGKVYLEGYILYYLYEEWCDKFKRRRKYNIVKFSSALSAFYESAYIQETTQFRIDADIFKYLPDTKLAALRKGWRNSRGKKEKQKKSAKVSSA